MSTRNYTADVAVYELDRAERSQIDAIVADMRSRYSSASDPDFLFRAANHAARLPVDLVDFLRTFELCETTAGVVVTGLEVDDSKIGPTPAHWSAQPVPESTVREEMFFVLLGSLLGEPFGWATLQDGRIIHDVLPVRGEEGVQSGHGTVNLEWHTEDGFHPNRCDYLGLMCLRNHDRVATTFGSVAMIDIPKDVTGTLFEPRFVIRPDDEHLRSAPTDATTSVHDIARTAAPVPVLFGDRNQPYLRIDPYFMDPVADDEMAATALKCLTTLLEDALGDLTLAGGDIAFIDNYRAIHGRRPFSARHDGTDRWLKKIVITRDLRGSRQIRSAAQSRVLV